jgi:UDP-2,3-diacylglucosamine pyrophosphatase LpxH
MAEKNQVVVLSDIHIGNGTPTCWYQTSVHDAYLAAAVEWIVKQEHVREVLFLGDLFDVWTYPPSVRPPGMQQILAANRTLLGPSGPFARLVKALPGHVNLMLGNHDGTLNASDIALLNRSLGGNLQKREAITLISKPVYLLGAEGTRTAFSHGHHWCMFNAPDELSPWANQLPLGHLVSRAIAYRWSRDLTPPDTVADKPNTGNPDGIDAKAAAALVGKIAPLVTNTSDDIASILVDYICDVTKMTTRERIILPNGTTTTGEQAKRDFQHLFKHWRTVKEGRRLDAYRAAVADVKGDYLAWFAQRLAMGTSSDLVVMGHTHSAIQGMRRSPVNYINSGYMCVSRPDMAATPVTFAVVDIDRASAQLFKVDGAGNVLPATAKELPSPIVGAEDYASYARIANRTGRPLTLVGAPKQVLSYWAVAPPKVIPRGGRADIWLQDLPGPAGSDGAFSYSDGQSAEPLEFGLRCGTLTGNAVSSPVDSYETKTGDGVWHTGDPDRGHPLQARFALAGPRRSAGNGGGPASPHVTSTTVNVPAARRREISSAHADYLALARLILDTRKYSDWRGKVLTHALLISRDGKPLLEIDTEPATQRGISRLKNPPKHVLGPEVFDVPPNPYGAFQFLFIQPNDGALPPAFGGFLFLPAKGSPNLNLVTLNVGKLDESYKGKCSNVQHAETQFTRWVEEQPAAWRVRVDCMHLHNGSRKGDLAYSPCNSCCEDLAHFLDSLNRPPRGDGTVYAAMSWSHLYTNTPCTGHPTSKSGIDWLVGSHWKLQGAMPPGVPEKVGKGIKPGESPCVDPARSTR